MTLLLPFIPILIILQVFLTLKIKKFKFTIPLFLLSLLCLFLFYSFTFQAMDITDSQFLTSEQKNTIFMYSVIIYGSLASYISINCGMFYYWYKNKTKSIQ
jgi:hypothetical protein